MDMITCRKRLQVEFTRRLTVNPNYSLRAFARDLKLYPSQLCEVFKGRKGLSRDSIARISKNLQWGTTRTLKAKPADDITPLTWYHLALLELATREVVEDEPKSIGRRLGISTLAARQAIVTLSECGLVQVRNGHLRAVPERIFFGSDTPSSEIRRFHKEFLQLAARQIDLTEYQERELSSSILALTEDQVQDFRRRIRLVVEEFANLANSQDGNKEIYGLGLQLFKISKPINKRKSKGDT